MSSLRCAVCLAGIRKQAAAMIWCAHRAPEQVRLAADRGGIKYEPPGRAKTAPSAAFAATSPAWTRYLWPSPVASSLTVVRLGWRA